MNNDIIINIDDPEVIVTDEYSTDYNLPVATASTLGGVKIGDNVDATDAGVISIPVASDDTAGVIKVGTNLSIDENGVLSATGGASVTVDSALSTVSTNPVQNRVIASQINSTNSTVSGISSTVSNHTTQLSNIGQSITDLSTAVNQNANDIDSLENSQLSQDNLISTNTLNISTNTNNIASNTADITTLKADINEVIGYIDVANYWTSGNIQVFGKGKVGWFNLDLEGSLTINAGSSEDLYEINNTSLLPKYPCQSVLITDAGMLRVDIFTAGIIRAYNLSSSAMTITKLSGNIPVIFN